MGKRHCHESVHGDSTSLTENQHQVELVSSITTIACGLYTDFLVAYYDYYLHISKIE